MTVTLVFVLVFSVWSAYFGWAAGYRQGRADAERDFATIWPEATAKTGWLNPPPPTVDLTREERAPEGWPDARPFWR